MSESIPPGCYPRILFEHPIEELVPTEKGIHKLFTKKAKEEALRLAENELDFTAKNDITSIFFTDKEYPARLRECKTAPIVLYQKGTANLNPLRCLSIVGTRQPSQQGIDITKELVREISKAFPDTTIVSGLAYGIDITAHKTALHYNLPTIAILGHGLQTIYPATHRNFAEQIIAKEGALLTQYISTDKIHPKNFIERNNIVATIADATLVIESKEKGGAMTTAQIAASYSRDVLAVPGSIYSEKSKGCNKLIKTQIAALIENVKDIGYALRWESAQESVQQRLLFELSAEEQAIIQLLQQKGKMNIDIISSQLNVATKQLLPIITQLEFKEVLLAHPGKFYSLRK